MKSILCVDILICSIVLVIAMAGLSHAELEQAKNRRGGGGTAGLFAFPRVGRSDPSLSSNLHETESSAMPYENYFSQQVGSMEDYEEYPKGEIKRTNLRLYPRVGRPDAEMRKWARFVALQQALDKRTGPSASSGMWFGPRLGKRSLADGTDTDARAAE